MSLTAGLPPVPGKLPKKNVRRRFELGRGGLLISALLHLAVAIVACFWVASAYSGKKKPIEDFSTGFGGGSGGANANIYECRISKKNAHNIVKSENKLTVKNGKSGVTLPEMPALGASALEADSFAGGASKGLGGGSGGGEGTGQGIGRGDGKNMIGKFKMVMGVKIEAKKIAVYLDDSGSMRPYLERVKKEIYAQYPDADIFAFSGLRITVEDGAIRMGRASGEAGEIKRSGKRKLAADAANEKLSGQGKAVFAKYERNFRQGSGGAWIDILSGEDYGALIVFSDFQDGVRQTNTAGEMLFEDQRGHVTTKDRRTAGERAWEREWLAKFSAPNSPKLYLFSIQIEPQKIWRDCVRASRGKIKMMPELRKTESEKFGGKK